MGDSVTLWLVVRGERRGRVVSSHLTLITTLIAVVGRMKSAPSMDMRMTCERSHIDRVMIRGRYTKLRVWRLGIVLSLCGAQGLTLPPAARHRTTKSITPRVRVGTEIRRTVPVYLPVRRISEGTK